MSEEPASPSDAPAPAPGAPQEGGPADSAGQPTPSTPPTPAPEQSAAPTPPTPPAAADGPTAQDWATYHRKVKEFRRAEQESKQREQRLKHWEEREAKLKQNPWDVAREMLGEDWYEKATLEYARAGQPPTAEDEIRSVKEKLAEFEREKQEAREAAARSQREQTVDSAKAAAIALAKAQKDKFKGLAQLGDDARDTVWAMAQELAPEHGDDLTDSMVLEQAETRLHALWTRLNEVYGAPATAPASEKTNGASANGSKTLTAKGVSGMAPAVNGEVSLPLRPDERDREILKQHRFYRD